mgnify:CR=1 FL=1
MSETVKSPFGTLYKVDGELVMEKKPMDDWSGKIEDYKKNPSPPQRQPKGKSRGGGTATQGVTFRGVR